MLVQCLKNDVNDVDVKDNEEWYREQLKTLQMTNDTLHISVDKAYVVYAIDLSNPYPQFFIADDTFSTYPVSYFSLFFKILEPRFSRYWLLGENWQWEENFVSKNLGFPQLITFKEWAHSRWFYEKLVDGETKELRLFEKYKKLMDFEFARPEFNELAVHLQDYWVQCPFCDDAWEANTHDELLQCPTCLKIILNPLADLNK